MPANCWITIYHQYRNGEVLHLYHTTSRERAEWRLKWYRDKGVQCGMKAWRGLGPFISIERDKKESEVAA